MILSSIQQCYLIGSMAVGIGNGSITIQTHGRIIDGDNNQIELPLKQVASAIEKLQK
jgi:hypothetical protein